MMNRLSKSALVLCLVAVPVAAAAQAPRFMVRDEVKMQVRHQDPQPPKPPTPPSRRVIEQQRERARERARVVEQRDNRIEQTERVLHTFKIGSRGALLVSNLSGDITVTRGGGDEVKVEAIKTARARTLEQAREALPAVRVEFSERAGRAEVKTVYSREYFSGTSPRTVGVSVVYNITAPEGTGINAKSLSGNVRITGIKGELTVGSTSGDVVVTDAARLESATSTSGNVEITDLRSDTPLELQTVSGDVIVRQSRVPRLELSTVSGRLVIDNVQSGQVEAQSVSGDVEFLSPFAKGGRYELNSHSGNVRIAVGNGAGFEIDANSFSGGVQSAIELKERSSGVRDASRGGRPRRLRGVFGDGSALLDVTTFSGSVIIVRK